MRILLAEADESLAQFIRKGLEAEHYAVDVCPDGVETSYLAQQFNYDLLLLDVNLDGGRSGMQVLRTICAVKAALPILVISGANRAEDRARALDMGADDVVTRPLSFCELAARIRALLRRGALPAASVLRTADLQLDRVEHAVERAGRRISLTSKEFSLLEYLMRNQGRALSRPMILEHVWALSFDTTTNLVDVYINYLRRKVDDGFDPPLIHTVRGVGYRLQAPGVTPAAAAAPLARRTTPGPGTASPRRNGEPTPRAMAMARSARR
jgi:two-component system copper resistance phosphate regulon response regulator CusR